MSEPFLAEVRIVGFNFAPRGYAQCDGQIMPINQNQSLYSLLGTTYGGDGRTSFALPDMRARTPIHVGGSHGRGQRPGVETVTLTGTQIPNHNHVMEATDQDGTSGDPTNNLFAGAQSALGNVYSDATASVNTQLATAAIGEAGGSPHDNMMPYLAINYIIALKGVFPSRN